MQQVTLRPGDYVATEGITEEQYNAVARAFMNAGANGEQEDYGFEKWVSIGFASFIGWDSRDDEFWDTGCPCHGFNRELTIDEALNATNAGNAAPPSPLNCRCVMKPIIKETDMKNWTPAGLFKDGDGEWGQREGDCYVTRSYKDGRLIKTVYYELGGVEKETDMQNWKPEVGEPAQSLVGKCEVLAIDDKRGKSAVRWTDGNLGVVNTHLLKPPMTEEDEAVEEMMRIYHANDSVNVRDGMRDIYRAGYRKQPEPAEDMTDPANWREGDWVECVSHDVYGSTKGRRYPLEIDPMDNALSYRDDDGEWCTIEPISAFRFHSRP